MILRTESSIGSAAEDGIAATGWLWLTRFTLFITVSALWRLSYPLDRLCQRALPFILERIGCSFFQPDAFELRRAFSPVVFPLLLQQLIYFNAQIFSGWNNIAKRFNVQIQVSVVQPLDNFLLNQPVETCEVDHHSCCRIHLARYRDFQHVIVPVPVRVVALAVDARIFFRRERVTVKAMSGREPVAPNEMNH